MHLESGIQQTHQLIDKIELRVQKFLKTQSMKSLPQQQPLIFQKQEQNQQLNHYIRTPQIKEKIQPQVQQSYSMLENIPPQKMSQLKQQQQQQQLISQSRTSDGQIPLLQEIQEIDQSYKQEISQLTAKLSEYKSTIETLKTSLNDSQTELLIKQKKIDQMAQESEVQQILIQTLRDQNSYLTTEIQQNSNQVHSPSYAQQQQSYEQQYQQQQSQQQYIPKIENLQKEVQEERIKSEKLSMDILEIKQRVEKQRDSAKMNSEFLIVEKLVKKLEEAQESQLKQNQQFMKCVIQFLERSTTSQKQNNQSTISQHNKKSKLPQSALKYKK